MFVLEIHPVSQLIRHQATPAAPMAGVLSRLDTQLEQTYAFIYVCKSRCYNSWLGTWIFCVLYHTQIHANASTDLFYGIAIYWFDVHWICNVQNMASCNVHKRAFKCTEYLHAPPKCIYVCHERLCTSATPTNEGSSWDRRLHADVRTASWVSLGQSQIDSLEAAREGDKSPRVAIVDGASYHFID